MATADAVRVESLILIAMLCLIGRSPQEINTRRCLEGIGPRVRSSLDDDFREGWDPLHASSGPAVQFRLAFYAGHPAGDGGHARAPRLVRGRPDRWPAQRARRAGERCVLHIQSAVDRREAGGGPRMHPACVRRGTTGPDRSHRRCRSDAVERALHRTRGRARRPGDLSLVSLRKAAQGARGDRPPPLCRRAGDDAVRQAQRDVRAAGN